MAKPEKKMIYLRKEQGRLKRSSSVYWSKPAGLNKSVLVTSELFLFGLFTRKNPRWRSQSGDEKLATILDNRSRMRKSRIAVASASVRYIGQNHLFFRSVLQSSESNSTADPLCFEPSHRSAQSCAWTRFWCLKKPRHNSYILISRSILEKVSWRIII